MRYLWILLLSVLLAPAAFAVDGAVLSGGCAEQRGNRECRAYLLCDSDTAATTCDEFDLGQGTSQGYPSYFVIKLLHETGCTAGAIEVEPRGAEVSDTDEISLVSTTTRLQTDDVQSRAFDTDHKFIDAVLSGSFAGCTDIDVSITLWYER